MMDPIDAAGRLRLVGRMLAAGRTIAHCDRCGLDALIPTPHAAAITNAWQGAHRRRLSTLDGA